ncbi:hypothetical protein IWW34DRAFT_136831 [Fusarium oxysporum f. sp. albedinis]|nr:hypothetical protein IWW34DRAFT_136831 [Fusarium oxysporum f. sp. albedinis]
MPQAYAIGAGTGKAGCPNRLGQLWAGTGGSRNLGWVEGGVLRPPTQVKPRGSVQTYAHSPSLRRLPPPYSGSRLVQTIFSHI